MWKTFSIGLLVAALNTSPGAAYAEDFSRLTEKLAMTVVADNVCSLPKGPLLRLGQQYIFDMQTSGITPEMMQTLGAGQMLSMASAATFAEGKALDDMKMYVCPTMVQDLNSVVISPEAETRALMIEGLIREREQKRARGEAQ